MTGFNNPQGVAFSREGDFALFDALPRKLKHLLHDAAEDMSTAWVLRIKTRLSLDNDEWTEEIESQLTRLTCELVRRTYGTSHPQAFPVDREAGNVNNKLT